MFRFLSERILARARLAAMESPWIAVPPHHVVCLAIAYATSRPRRADTSNRADVIAKLC